MTREIGAAEAFRFQPHPEVWLLIVAIVALGYYATRVIGPKVVPGEDPVSGTQRRWFVAGVLTLWVAADWPIHDIGERYLYSVHMVQHTLLTFVVPPMFLLATPTWLARLIVGDGWFAGPMLRRLTHPVVAGVVFNALVVLSHWQKVVNTSVESGAFHYGIHVALVGGAVLMWLPVCGPLPERRLGEAGRMIYLFLMSIVPTVPASWLTFAEGTVYDGYDTADRLWGISTTSDQQLAGLVMKLIAGFYLWGLIVVLFFRWASREMRPPDPARRRAENAARVAARSAAVDAQLAGVAADDIPGSSAS